jgi:hypothetical protein
LSVTLEDVGRESINARRDLKANVQWKMLGDVERKRRGQLFNKLLTGQDGSCD